MAQPRRVALTDAVDALLSVAPIISRWIERLLAAHNPPLTVAQFLAMRAIASDELTGSELARRAGVSGPAVSQLLSGLAAAGLLERSELAADRRRHVLRLSASGLRALSSAQRLLAERLSTLLAELPRPEADALARALPRVDAMLSGAPPRRPNRPPARRPLRPRGRGER
jgi:DNA-binding MarR family transcriptional regulator